jgi:hydroxylamine reductase (hybrid-cluster protein)
VALSSSEAEYYAMSEAAKEIKFLTQVIESMGLPIKKPIMVYVDNVGAIFVAENHSATKHTRHIDARYHFVREFILDGDIKIVFVTSALNKADIFTKNISNETYRQHIDSFILHQKYIDHEVSHTPDRGGVLEHQSNDGVNPDLGYDTMQDRDMDRMPMVGAQRKNATVQHKNATVKHQLEKQTQIMKGDRLHSNHHNRGNTTPKGYSGYAHN